MIVGTVNVNFTLSLYWPTGEAARRSVRSETLAFLFTPSKHRGHRCRCRSTPRRGSRSSWTSGTATTRAAPPLLPHLTMFHIENPHSNDTRQYRAEWRHKRGQAGGVRRGLRGNALRQRPRCVAPVSLEYPWTLRSFGPRLVHHMCISESPYRIY
jgi:hypothetical protein